MDAQEEEFARSFRDYIQLLLRRRFVIILTMVFAVAAALGISALTVPVYAASADLLLTPQLSSALLQANSSSLPAPTVDVPTDLQIIQENALANVVRKSVLNAPPVSAVQLGTTNVVRLTVQSTDPKLAARAVNAYVNDYIHSQQIQAVNALNGASQIVQSHIATVQDNINSINDKIAHAGAATDTTGLASQLTSLEAEKATLQQELSNYQFTALVDTGGGQVASVATVPAKPIKPKPVEYAIIAALAGLFVGIALALMLEYFDDAIRTKEDLEQASNGLPLLGMIPEIVDWRDTHAQYLVSRSAPKSAPAEAYRSLRTSIQFMGLDRSLKTIQFTSPNASEGKTTTMANLAMVSAQAGMRVVMVCCDLRRPRIHEFFGASNQVGFTSVLLGNATLDEALQPVPGTENLKLLASGPIPPNPSELLSGPSARHIFEMLSAEADLVLIDSPPVLPVTDAMVLTSRVDAVVIVVSARASDRGHVSRALQNLVQVEAPIAGLVLNRASETDTYTYYRYAYGSPVESSRERASTNGASEKVGASRRGPKH